MINFDGKLLPENSTYLNVDNKAFSEGDALIETLRIVHGNLFFWEEHYLRLMASMRILRMEIPMDFTMEFLNDELMRTVRNSNLSDKAVLASLYVFPKSTQESGTDKREVSYIIRIREHTSPFYLHSETAYEIDLYKDFYVQAGMLSNLSTVNKTLKNIARVYALENGYSDCILLNDHKNVVQTLKGNLFLVSGDTIKTPPLADGCENGILRKKVMELIEKTPEVSLVEASISPFELQKADEIFVTDIADGITSVTHYRKTEYATEVARRLLGKLNAVARFS